MVQAYPASRGAQAFKQLYSVYQQNRDLISVGAYERGSDEQIDAAMSGNICRCGTYNSIRKAIHRAAEIQAAMEPGAALILYGLCQDEALALAVALLFPSLLGEQRVTARRHRLHRDCHDQAQATQAEHGQHQPVELLDARPPGVTTQEGGVGHRPLIGS